MKKMTFLLFFSLNFKKKFDLIFFSSYSYKPNITMSTNCEMCGDTIIDLESGLIEHETTWILFI